MAVYTETKSYRTKGNMGMIDVTRDFQEAVANACREKKIRSGIITGFTTGGVAALTTLEFEPGLVKHDVREAMQGIAPYRMRREVSAITTTMKRGTMTTAVLISIR